MSGCHAWLNPLNPPFTRPGKGDIGGSTFSLGFSYENAGIVRFTRCPHPGPRAADLKTAQEKTKIFPRRCAACLPLSRNLSAGVGSQTGYVGLKPPGGAREVSKGSPQDGPRKPQERPKTLCRLLFVAFQKSSNSLWFLYIF